MKKRLDQILVDDKYFESKNKAQNAILSGNVKINGSVVLKAGTLIETDNNFSIEVEKMKFVSRGGYKLEKALNEFNINLEGKICLDAGASTGGFTDCMLQNGAKKVYSVDVGHNQLAKYLLDNPKVKSIEHINLKDCNISQIYDINDEKSDFIAADLSFISLTKVLSNLKIMTKEKFEIVALIKPQFETEQKNICKNGIVKDKKTHCKIIEKIIKYCNNIDLYVNGLTYSPIKGTKGNIEYLIYLTNTNQNKNIDIEEVVDKAFISL